VKDRYVMDSEEARQADTDKPHQHFDEPQQVVTDPALSDQDKAEALETLEQDARLLAKATEEGMAGGERSKLPEVLSAKKALGTSTDAAKNPPPGSKAEVAKEADTEKLDP
jgi:hypothetical protein